MSTQIIVKSLSLEDKNDINKGLRVGGCDSLINGMEYFISDINCYFIAADSNLIIPKDDISVLANLAWWVNAKEFTLYETGRQHMTEGSNIKNPERRIHISHFEYKDKIGFDLNNGLIVTTNDNLEIGGRYSIKSIGYKFKIFFACVEPNLIVPEGKLDSHIHERLSMRLENLKPPLVLHREYPERTILQEAQDLVYGDRQADYGTVKENFTSIAKLWSVVLGVEVTPEQVGLCMVQVKVSRQLFKPKRDNLIDGAGYFATIEKMERE